MLPVMLVLVLVIQFEMFVAFVELGAFVGLGVALAPALLRFQIAGRRARFLVF